MANINVFGNALGEVVPDIAVVSVTVGTLAYSFVEDAKREFGNSLKQARAALQTADKKYEKRASTRTWHDADRDVDKHQVSATVTAKFENGKDGELKQAIDALASLENVSFSTYWEVSPKLSKDNRDRLLAEAVTDAQRQAAAIASAAGQKLVKLSIVAEPELFPDYAGDSYSAMRPRGLASMDMLGGMADDGVAMDIDLAPEPIDISVQIAVSYCSE